MTAPLPPVPMKRPRDSGASVGPRPVGGCWRFLALWENGTKHLPGSLVVRKFAGGEFGGPTAVNYEWQCLVLCFVLCACFLEGLCRDMCSPRMLAPPEPGNQTAILFQSTRLTSAPPVWPNSDTAAVISQAAGCAGLGQERSRGDG